MSVILKKFYDIFDYNSSTLSGCLDVIVVQRKDGSFTSSPFHLRVGKLKAFSTKLKKLQLFINGVDAKQHMLLNAHGIGYFENEVGGGTSSETEVDTSSACFQSDEETPVEKSATPRLSKETESPHGVSEKEAESPELLQRAHSGPEHLESSQVLSKSNRPGRKMSDYKTKDDFLMQRSQTQLPNLEPAELEDKREAIQLSLCGHLLTEGLNPEEIDSIFQQHLIPFNKFDSQAVEILQNENLMIKIGSRIYDSYFGLPQLVAHSVYGNGLSDLAMSNLKQKLVKMQASKDTSLEQEGKGNKKPPRFVKSLKPPASFWADKNLKEGLNVLQYKFRGNLDTDYVMEARIFYYPFGPQYKLIVSDIDGTITRSDILGHLMPFIYRDWSHMGLTELYNNLVKNGYHIVYLTARNIGQANKTLTYLKSVRQKGLSLPEGPLITSPDTLYESFKREMIIRNPEVFKIRVLRQLKKLFGGSADFNPLFGGFGNKDTDAIAYAVVGISKKRIFTINPDGDIFLLKSGHVTNYDDLNRRVDELFPVHRTDGVQSEESDTHSRDNIMERLAEAI